MKVKWFYCVNSIPKQPYSLSVRHKYVARAQKSGVGFRLKPRPLLPVLQSRILQQQVLAGLWRLMTALREMTAAAPWSAAALMPRMLAAPLAAFQCGSMSFLHSRSLSLASQPSCIASGSSNADHPQSDVASSAAPQQPQYCIGGRFLLANCMHTLCSDVARAPAGVSSYQHGRETASTLSATQPHPSHFASAAALQCYPASALACFSAALWPRLLATPHARASLSGTPSARCAFATAAAGGGGKRWSSVYKKEAAKFAALSGEWWNPSGPFAPLHAMNPLRVAFIRDATRDILSLPLPGAASSGTAGTAAQPRASPAAEAGAPQGAPAGGPLAGLRLLDVGCGGGLLSEALAREGATVTGIDVSDENVAAATMHAEQDAAIADRSTCAPLQVCRCSCCVAAFWGSRHPVGLHMKPDRIAQRSLDHCVQIMRVSTAV